MTQLAIGLLLGSALGVMALIVGGGQ